METLTAGATTPVSRPITSWRAAADVLGVSEDTLKRHRKAAGLPMRAAKRPWFASADEVIAWYRTLRPAPETASTPAPTRRRRTTAPLDARALVAELTRPVRQVGEE